MRLLSTARPNYFSELIAALRQCLRDEKFIARHRAHAAAFTRRRALPFERIMIFILQKTTRSIQRHLHAFWDQMTREIATAVTPGAVTQARAKFKHTAFIALNRETVLPLVYAPAQAATIRRWHGHRLVGVDSSLVRLPRSATTEKEFGLVEIKNQLGATGTAYPEGRLSVVYDLLNRLGLDGRLEKSALGEVALASQQLAQLAAGDVVIMDRGFTGFIFLALLRQGRAHFIARCSTGSFLAAQEMFRRNRAGQSRRVKLFAAPEHKAQLQRLGLPQSLVVRFISVRLPTGELEVLATSLLDEVAYPTKEFATVYHWRWNHETYYGLLKGRLDLENWSGQSAEAVRQDFHAAVLLANLESILSGPAQAAVVARSAQAQYPQRVNRAVSYHALKERLLDLLLEDTPIQDVLAELQARFTGSPVTVRPKRPRLRQKLSLPRSYHFQRNVRKTVF
jgi:hypothetical protein